MWWLVCVVYTTLDHLSSEVRRPKISPPLGNRNGVLRRALGFSSLQGPWELAQGRELVSVQG